MSAPLLRRPAPAPYFHHFLIFLIPPSGEGSQYFAGAIFRSRFKKRGEGGLNARSKLALKTQKHRLYVPLETSEELKLYVFWGIKTSLWCLLFHFFSCWMQMGNNNQYASLNIIYVIICIYLYVLSNLYKYHLPIYSA